MYRLRYQTATNQVINTHVENQRLFPLSVVTIIPSMVKFISPPYPYWTFNYHVKIAPISITQPCRVWIIFRLLTDYASGGDAATVVGIVAVQGTCRIDVTNIVTVAEIRSTQPIPKRIAPVYSYLRPRLVRRIQGKVLVSSIYLFGVVCKHFGLRW